MLRHPLFLYLFIFFVLLLTPALAQESDGLGGYVPPPLFGSPNLPPANHKADDLGLPAISKQTDKIKADLESTKSLVEKRIVKEPPAERPPVKKHTESLARPRIAEPKIVKPSKKIQKVPKPAEKPKKPMAKASQPKIPVKQEPEPIDLLNKKDIPPPSVFQEGDRPKIKPPKVTSEGVVKGPKTMPSNKKKAVEAEVTFDNEINPDPPVNILERMNAPEESLETQPIKDTAQIEKIKASIPLPAFKRQEDGSQKIVMLYTQAQFEIKEPQLNVLEQLIIPALQENTSLRLIIYAYASSSDEELNSARRLSLSRALAVRDYLLSRNIQTNRIDVRALGAETNMQPLDRVELTLTP